MKTHYDVLGVPFDADYETIKTAYRRALKKHHPDLADGGGAGDLQSKQIIDAHTVLRDPSQRARYDQTLKHRRQQRRRLFMIIALLTAGLVCVGSLVVVELMLNGR